MKPRFVHNKNSKQRSTKQKFDIKDIDYISITTDNEDQKVCNLVRESIVKNEDPKENESFIIQYSGAIRDGLRLCKNCGKYLPYKQRCKCEQRKVDTNGLLYMLKEELEQINGHKVSINGKVIKKAK